MQFPYFSINGSAHQRIFITPPSNSASFAPTFDLFDVNPKTAPEAAADAKAATAAVERKAVTDETKENLEAERMNLRFRYFYQTYNSLFREKSAEWRAGTGTGGKPTPEYFVENWVAADGTIPKDVIENVIEQIVPYDKNNLTDRNKNPVVGEIERAGGVKAEITAADFITALKDPKHADHSKMVDIAKELQTYIIKMRAHDEIEASEMQRLKEGLNERGGDVLLDISDAVQNNLPLTMILLGLSYVLGGKSVFKWGAVVGGILVANKLTKNVNIPFLNGRTLGEFLSGKSLAEIRHTAVAGFLERRGKNDEMSKEATARLCEVPLNDIMTWHEGVEKRVGKSWNLTPEMKGENLYFKGMPSSVENVIKQMADSKDIDKLAAAQYFWEIWKDFLMDTAEKNENAFEKKLGTNPEVGLGIVKATFLKGYTPPDAYMPFRTIVPPRLRNDLDKDESLTFGEILDTEVTLADIEKSETANMPFLERLEKFGLSQWKPLAKLIDEKYNWTKTNLEKFFDFITDSGIPSVKGFVEQAVALGMKFGTDFYSWAKGEVVMWYGRNQVRIQSVKDAGKFVLSIPGMTLAKGIDVATDALPFVLTTLKSMWSQTTMVAKEVFGMQDKEKEQVSPANEFELYQYLKDLGLVDNIVRMYGIGTMKNDLMAPEIPIPGRYNIPLLMICNEIMTSPASKKQFGDEMQQYMSATEINQYSTGGVNWTDIRGIAHTSSAINFASMTNVPKWLIGRAFIMDSAALRIFDKVANGGLDIASAFGEAIKFLGGVGSIGNNQLQIMLWNAVEMVKPGVKSNVSGVVGNTLFAKNAILRAWNTPNVIWTEGLFMEEMVKPMMATISDDHVRLGFHALAQQLFPEIMARCSLTLDTAGKTFPLYLIHPGGGSNHPVRADVQLALKAIFDQLNSNRDFIVEDWGTIKFTTPIENIDPSKPAWSVYNRFALDKT
ncbi:hypothetical protein HZA38_01965 [Candidatus Peregrinibacteria bacterium]|nr:hypothetical protein [Candidatus Peregrinibacteria bacterium]